MTLQGEQREREFRSLRGWLSREGRELRAAGITVAALGEEPEPDEMGGAFEIVQFVFDTVAQYGSLAVALAAWRSAHPVRSSATFERNGVRVTLTGADLRDEETIRRVLERLRDEGAPGGGS